LPRIEDAVKVGEIFRRALMSKMGSPVPTISGRDENGKPLRDPTHAHAFFLPEDHDGDGFIDHLVLYARHGLVHPVQRAVERLTRLWLAEEPSRPTEDDAEAERGRREWRVALEGFGNPSMFPDSHLLRCSTTWISATPYLRPWHAKGGPAESETRRMLEEECRRRRFPAVEAQLLTDPEGRQSGRRIPINQDRDQGVLHFHRFRNRRGLTQPDRSGAALRLIFAEPIPGPLAFGFGCHYGLGLFRAG
jgi:CRISPR-associated protein Csb2